MVDPHPPGTSAADFGGRRSPAPRPHPPITSEFGRKFAQTLKPLGQTTQGAFDQAFADSRQLFRERYNAEIHADSGFMGRVLEDAGIRRSLVDVVEALELLPPSAIKGNPALKHMFMGEEPPKAGWRGWYSWGFDSLHVSKHAFKLTSRYTPDRSNAVFEGVLHEVGHAVHWWLGWARTKPFFDATWNLPKERQGEGIWGFGGLYTKRIGTVKSGEGLTDYGSRDPVEDWAETWRILFLPDRNERRRRILSRITGREYERFKIMRRILVGSGIEVPDE